MQSNSKFFNIACRGEPDPHLQLLCVLYTKLVLTFQKYIVVSVCDDDENVMLKYDKPT